MAPADRRPASRVGARPSTPHPLLVPQVAQDRPGTVSPPGSRPRHDPGHDAPSAPRPGDPARAVRSSPTPAACRLTATDLHAVAVTAAGANPSLADERDRALSRTRSHVPPSPVAEGLWPHLEPQPNDGTISGRRAQYSHRGSPSTLPATSLAFATEPPPQHSSPVVTVSSAPGGDLESSLLPREPTAEATSEKGVGGGKARSDERGGSAARKRKRVNPPGAPLSPSLRRPWFLAATPPQASTD